MITLKVSFLLAINVEEKKKVQILDKEEKMKKGKSKPSKKESKKSSKKEKKRKKKVKKVESEEQFAPYSKIEVENPIIYVHLEYDLFPKKFKYGVDVVCWGPVAKIYSKNGSKAVRTVNRNNIVWVPVFLEHYLNPLSTELIRQLLTQNIVLHIETGTKKISKKAKTDKTRVFFLPDEDANYEFFPEVFPAKIPPDLKNREVDNILNKMLCFPIQSEIVTWIFNIDAVHAYKVTKIVSKRSIGQEIHGKDFVPEPQKPQKGKKKQKDKKAKRSKKSKSKKSSNKGAEKNINLNFKIPAHVLLSDPRLATYQIKNSENRLEEVYILLSSDNILTVAQRVELCPLVAKIRKINNLPDDILKRNDLMYVFANCVIPGITEFKTFPRPVGPTLHFNETKFIATADFPRGRVKELLQTSKIRVEIYGLKKLPELTAPTKGKKNKKAKKKKEKKSEENTQSDEPPPELLLALASFDLSCILEPQFHFKEKGQCYSLSSLLNAQKKIPVNYRGCFVDQLTLNELHFCTKDTYPASPLLDADLFLNNTTLKFEANFAEPMHPIYWIRDTTQTYKRLLVILFKREVAKLLLAAILLHNHQFFGTGPLLIPYFLAAKRPVTSDSEEDREQILSGFILDDGNCFVLYVEGPTNGFILSLLHQVGKINYSIGKVFYNSDYAFEDRLFPTLVNFSGLLFINLKLPFAEILAQEKNYVRGNVPNPCLKAIQKLDLIFQSNSLKPVLNQDLLPSETELLSLSMEYGVQIRYKSGVLDDVESDVDDVPAHTNIYDYYYRASTLFG